jgi:hypothetical protein
VVCEGHGFDQTACLAQACCIFQFVTKECHSAVGNGPCTGGSRGIDYQTPAPTVAAAAGLASTLLASGVTPPPQFGGRRLDDDDLDVSHAAQRRRSLPHQHSPNDDDDLDEEEVDRRPIQQATISFKEGLRYEVDRVLLDEMIKQGMFRNMIDSDSEEEKFEVHSYTITDLGAPPTQQAQEKSQAAYGIVTASIVIGSALLLVVATLARRSTMKLYQRVEDSSSQEEQSLVELE